MRRRTHYFKTKAIVGVIFDGIEIFVTIRVYLKICVQKDQINKSFFSENQIIIIITSSVYTRN